MDASHTTAALAAGAYETSVVAVGRTYALRHVTTSIPARVRLYTTAAGRDADVGRAAGTDPPLAVGCVLDAVTTAGALDIAVAPAAIGFTDGTADVPCTITNTSGAAGAVTATLHTTVLEA